MKILIISDTHGRRGDLDLVLERERDIDMLIHLGDLERDEDWVKAVAGCPIRMVSGNNDFYSGLPEEQEFTLGKYRVLMTHGHKYYVSVNTEKLRRATVARGANLVLFGHTHKPYMDVEGDLKVINPGSLSYPRQEGRKGTYVLMEIDRRGEARFHLRYV